MKHPWFKEWPEWKHRAWYRIRLLTLADGIVRGVGLTPEQLGCRERETLRTGKAGYNVAHVQGLRKMITELEEVK